MNNNSNEFENNIKDIFTKEIYVPPHVKKTIQQTIEKQKDKRMKNKKVLNFIKILSTACACCIVVTGIVFAKDISNFIKNFFSNNEGMDNAIEHGYIDKPNMEYVSSNDTEIKIDKVLMDDYNLNLEFNIKINENMLQENIKEISFPDMLITDEEKNILYCEDEQVFKEYCKVNNLEYIWKETNDKYINSGSNWYIKSINKDSISLIYNFYATNYPASKKIYINLNKIVCYENGKEFLIQGKWNIEYDVAEKFYNREEIIYNVTNCSSDKIKITEFIVSETSTKIQLIADEKPQLPYELTDDEETKNRKIQEELEREQNMTIEEFEKSRKFKNEYIENDNGEKYYPSKSTSEDEGYSYIDMSYLVHWQTFNLNKYNATNHLKLYLNYNGEDICVDLERIIC